MNLKNFKVIDRRHIHPYPVVLVIPSFMVFLKRYLKVSMKPVITFYDNGEWNVAVDVKDFAKGAEVMFKLYQKDNNIMGKFIKKFKKISKDYLKFTSTLMRDYSNVSDKDLLKLYKKYNKDYIKTYIYGECPAHALKEGLIEELKERLLQILGDEKKLNKIFSLLVTPIQENFIAEQEKDLLKIAIIGGSIKNHAKKYAWISVDYNGHPMTLKDFEKNLKKIKNPKKKLEQLKNAQKKIKQEQLNLKKMHKIDNQTFKLCKSAQDCVYLMDYKKKEFSKAHYHSQFLMKEIGKRVGLNLRQVSYLTYKEVEYLLKKKKKFEKKLADVRYKKSAYIADEKRFFFADSKLEKKIRKTLDNAKKVKELRGICGNPGKVKGRAKVIRNTKDFYKFKQGDILIAAFTTPNFTPVMRKAAGIVTDYGGITSHASIIARELNIPCVVGTENATKSIKDNDLIEIDAENCVVKKIK